MASPGVRAQSDVVRFQQDRFVIGFWYDPPADENMPLYYQQIAEADFNVAVGSFGATTPEQIDRQIALCANYGLKLFVWAKTDDLASLPRADAIWGYAVRDEPSAADFPQLAAKVAAIRQAFPGKLAYINLFPNYASRKQLGTDTYEEHVRRFVDEVDVDVLSMDHYPQFKPDKDGRDGYCETLAVMREHSLRKGIPFWNFFNVMPYGPQTDPTAGQLRWQVYTSLAYGAKGVAYFCYYTPRGLEFPKGGAILLRDGRLSRHYDQARAINRALRCLGPTLMQLTSLGVVRVTAQTDQAQALADSGIRAITPAPEDPPNNILVGTFRHADGRRAVLINNYHFAYTQWPTVTFDVDPAEVREVDQATGVIHPVIDDSPEMDGLQLSFDSGAGRLFLLP